MSARNSIPIHQARPARLGAARQKVETVVRAASTESPLSAEDIAARTGLPISQVRTHLSNMCTHGRAHNTQPGTRSARYAPGLAPQKTTAAPLAQMPSDDSPNYDGRELRSYSTRPGAMDAFALPSLQNGQRVARKAPSIIAAHGGLRMVRGSGMATDIVRKVR